MSRRKNTKPVEVSYDMVKLAELARADACHQLGVPLRMVTLSAGVAGNWVASVMETPAYPVGPYIDYSENGRIMVVVVGMPRMGLLNLDDPFYPAGTYTLQMPLANVIWSTRRYVLSEYERLKIKPPEDLDNWVGGWTREKLTEYLKSK